jgi:hypothetical protein
MPRHSEALLVTKPDMLHRTALRLKNIMHAGGRYEEWDGEGGGKQRVRKKRTLSCSITMSYVEWRQSVNERYHNGIDEITAPFTAHWHMQ